MFLISSQEPAFQFMCCVKNYIHVYELYLDLDSVQGLYGTRALHVGTKSNTNKQTRKCSG